MKRKRILTIIIIAVVLVSMVGVVVFAFKKHTDYIDQLYSKYNPQGAAIAIIENGTIAEVRNYGYGNTEVKKPVSEETQFKIASISKTITAYAVMKLVEEGKLDLDKPINTYLTKWTLPDTEFDENKVTLRTLMSHTSGITGSDETGYTEPLPTIEQALKSRNIQLKREPGKEFEYSEFAGFGICQLVIEEVTGTKFEDYMENNIFKPLGMNHTNYSNKNDTLATPYAGFNKAIAITPIVMNGGGGVTTTANDLALFVTELISFYHHEQNEMFMPQENTKSVAGVYGLGIIPRELKNGKTVYEHNGTLTGWNAQIVFEPISKNGMVIVTNSDRSYYMTYELMEKWSKKVLGEKAFDAQMQQITQTIWYMISALAVILLVNVIVLAHRLIKGTIGLLENAKRKCIISTCIILIPTILYYLAVYTEIPFQVFFQMKNYYLFTFFPVNFGWINILLVLHASFIILRSCMGKKESDNC